jgi:hypothetical protein
MSDDEYEHDTITRATFEHNAKYVTIPPPPARSPDGGGEGAYRCDALHWSVLVGGRIP